MSRAFSHLSQVYQSILRRRGKASKRSRHHAHGTAPNLRRRIGIEPLEPRVLLAGDYPLLFPTEGVPEYAVNSCPSSVVTADFNGDGTLDLAVGHEYASKVSILLGVGDGTFSSRVDYSVHGSRCVAAGDFNGDGKLDLAAGSDGKVTVLLDQGDGTLKRVNDFFACWDIKSLFTGDFNCDGYADLVAGGGGTVAVLLGYGDGRLREPLPFNIAFDGFNLTRLGVGDFNEDGNLDLVILYRDGHKVGVTVGRGDGTFGWQNRSLDRYQVALTPSSVVVADFNEDGHLDLAITNDWSRSVSILLGRGDGTFAREINDHVVSRGVTSLASGDFNADGHLDLAVTTAYNEVAVLLGQGDGNFIKTNYYPMGWGPQYAIAVGDFNQDGGLDLAAANYNGGTLSILLNQLPPRQPAQPPEDLGTVEFLQRSGLAVDGELWFSLTAAHEGVLSIDTSPSDLLLRLYDQDKNLLVESTLDGGRQRLDYLGAAESELFYLQLVGTATDGDLRVANLINTLEGNNIIIWDSPADDAVAVRYTADLGESGVLINVNINGLNYDVILNGENIQIQLEETHVGGTDTLALYDTPWDDVVHLGKQTLSGHFGPPPEQGGAEVLAKGYEVIHVYATAGGHDVAYLEDIPVDGNSGEDVSVKFKWEPQYKHAKMTGPGMYNRVKNFESVYAYAGGGNDTAIFYDTAGNDIFVGQKDGCTMWDVAESYYVAAIGFRTVRAYSVAGGYDAVWFEDSELKDEFHFKPNKSSLFDMVTGGAKYVIEARGFDEVFASAEYGTGTDVAKIWDTPGDDYVLAQGQQVSLYRGFPVGKPVLNLSHFERVIVRDSSGGTDRKELREPILIDLVFGLGWL